MRKIGCKFYLNKKAIVNWEMRSNLAKLLKQHMNYAIYDGVGLNNLHFYILKLFFWFISTFSILLFSMLNLYFFTFITLISVFSFFSFILIIRIGISRINIKKYLLGMIIIITVEITKVIGFIYGIIKKILSYSRSSIERKFR